MVLWTRAGTTSGGRYGGPAALVYAGGTLLAGGEISTPTGVDNLEQLIGADLIVPIGPPPWTAFACRHVLIQDAAYSTLLRGERRALHGRIARTLTELFPDVVAIGP